MYVVPKYRKGIFNNQMEFQVVARRMPTFVQSQNGACFLQVTAMGIMNSLNTGSLRRSKQIHQTKLHNLINYSDLRHH